MSVLPPSLKYVYCLALFVLHGIECVAGDGCVANSARRPGTYLYQQRGQAKRSCKQNTVEQAARYISFGMC